MNYLAVGSIARLGAVLLGALALAACSGENEPLPTYTVGGNATGLKGTVVLQNNGGDDLNVTGSGAFTFATAIKRGQQYTVTVATQPENQVCTVANASGVAADNVTNVIVNCIDSGIPTYTVGGTVSGLVGRVVLRNGPELLPVSVNGTFTFATHVVSGTDYAVSIATQPDGQTCTVANGSGTVGTANVTNITVTCKDNAPTTFTVGGTVSGLSGEVTLRNDNENLKVSSNGAFAFATRVQTGATYDVSVTKQPSGQTCTVTNGSGTVGTSNVSNILVACTDDHPPPGASYSIGGSVSGLTAGTLRLGLQHSGGGGSTIDVTSNGAFSFDPDQVPAGGAYTVTVVSQPDGQRCTVTNGTGTASADVTDVQVSCESTALVYTVGGTIEGLAGSGLVIENGTANTVQPDAGATSFTLPDQFADGEVYDLGIASQPTAQTCVITRSHGAVAAADVDTVRVTCLDNVTDPIVGTYAVAEHGPESVAYLTLFADGVYVYGSVENDPGCGGGLDGNGVEYGVYSYDASSGAFAIRSAIVDTNGGCGVWDGASRFSGSLVASGGGKDKSLTLEVPGRGSFELVPVDSKNNQIYGSFADAYHRNFWVFTDAGGSSVYVFNTQTQADEGATSQGYAAGVELACATLEGSPESGTLLADFTSGCQVPAPGADGAVDTNGTSGLSDFAGSWSYDVNGDLLVGSTFRGIRLNAAD